MEKEKIETREKEKTNTNDRLKNIVIVLLVIAVLVLTFFTIFSKINVSGNLGKSEFLRNINELQADISYYLGSMNRDTFGVYDDTQIITGMIIKDNGEKEVIKDNKNVALTPIVNIENKVVKNGNIAYQINEDNFEKVLNIQLFNHNGIKLLIQNGKVKIQIDVKPDWWSNDFDYLLVGNN